MTISIRDARARALFASYYDPSDAMTTAQVEQAVRDALRRLGGIGGCVCEVALAFGDHPDTAAARMRWARDTVAATWPRSMR